MTDNEITKALITGGITFLFMCVFGGFVALAFWVVRRWITKVNTDTSKAVSTDDCKDCKSETKRDDEEFKQEIRTGFSDIRDDIKDFKKEHKVDIRELHNRINYKNTAPAGGS